MLSRLIKNIIKWLKHLLFGDKYLIELNNNCIGIKNK